MTESMRAWRRETYGPAAGVALEQVPIPEPGAGEVLLRVRATSLNAGDVRLLLGDPLLVRPVFGLTRPKYPIRGMDAVGEVVAAGPGVIGVEVGDVVLGEMQGGGGLGEYVSVPATRVQPLPPGIDERIAVTLPVAGGTAWQALDLAGVGLGERPARVLIIGASGGVGTFAVQFAALRGAEVWASCSGRNASFVQGLGAVRTLDHRREPLSAIPGGHFDAVVDIAGGIDLRDLQRLVARDGVIVLVTGDGGHVMGPIPRMIRAALLSIGSGPRIRSLAASNRPEVLTKMLELLAAGRFAPVIAQEYDFADAGAALERLEAGHVVGKLVVRGS
ncbi:NAD(P)-dependent alcohol dehydrogenase [Microbacterium sp. MYb72]|uniref:NAD(P)-dependent alcohol dehydrogenase n=1 Tax=Microbacterium sp. MYb72 TaxID=1848693 RepID=UPI000CFE00C3|nr:NAD(P)-dependent alcohol dehydrogenase [Microbacterium sp. MYb72]PRB09361.1 NAD(P)-dependent alcohol dehydrogenase [Microbacterium sp. MYb72]